MQTSNDSTRIFQEKTLPKETRIAGWAALVKEYGIKAPVRYPAAISNGHIKNSSRTEGEWTIYDKRYWPGDDFGDHLSFALRHETIDLLVLKRLFEAIPENDILNFIRSVPTGAANRRVWFFYEFLTGKTLDVPDVAVAAIDAFDEDRYFTAHPRLSRRHKVRNNLMGTSRFCPIIRKSPKLKEYIRMKIQENAQEVIGNTGKHVVTRAASFMLLSDSRASFQIEGERPPHNRLERWGRAVLQAGKNPLTIEEIIRLHETLIEDTRFVKAGLRPDGVFLGDRDHEGDPLPEFIGARPSDVQDLLEGLLDSNRLMSESAIDPVIQAAATSFGFVYVHPFQDGNGRLHRCLIHHVLAERKFSPPGMLFPVSSAMLDEIDDYRDVLRGHTSPLMNYIEWRPTSEKNVEVLNDTCDLYRYFDCTDAAEFLYGCVERTVDHDLPMEIEYLQRHEKAVRGIMNTVEMPDRLAENLIHCIRQNKGTLGKKKREREFAALTDNEVSELEKIVNDSFEDFDVNYLR